MVVIITLNASKELKLVEKDLSISEPSQISRNADL